MEKLIDKLSKGKTVQLKHEHISKLPFDISKLSSQTQAKLSKAFHSGKGLRMKLDEDEIQGSGIFGRKADRAFKKAGIKKLLYKTGDALKPAFNEMADKAITALASNPTTMALAPVAMVGKDYINDPNKYQGKGVRSRMNRVLKKAGVKKLAYRIGDDLKDPMKEFIGHQASRVSNESLKPFSDALANSAVNAIDRPQDYGLGFASMGRGISGGAVSHNYLQMSDPTRPDLFKPLPPQRPMGSISNKSV